MEQFAAAHLEKERKSSSHSISMDTLVNQLNDKNFQIVLMAFNLEDCIKVRNLVNLAVILRERGHGVVFVVCKYDTKTAPSEIQSFTVYMVIIISLFLSLSDYCSYYILHAKYS